MTSFVYIYAFPMEEKCGQKYACHTKNDKLKGVTAHVHSSNKLAIKFVTGSNWLHLQTFHWWFSLQTRGESPTLET